MFKPVTIVSLISAGTFALVLTACEQKEAASTTAGPAEQAGEKIDKAAVRIGEELNQAAEKAGQGMQALGQKIQNEAEEAQKKE